MSVPYDNPNPRVLSVSRTREPLPDDTPLEARIYEEIRDILDPEHPNTLEELMVIAPSSISITPPSTDSPTYGIITIEFTPTVPHCSMAAVIGLSIHAKIRDAGLWKRPGADTYYKVVVKCKEDAHMTAKEISKQLGDKERVAAALENETIKAKLRECFSGGMLMMK